MNHLILSTLVVFLFLVEGSIAEKGTDEQVASHSEVIDLTTAFQNNGFKVRNSNFFGKASKYHPEIVAVNLCNGNVHWFTASSSIKSAKFKVSVFDETSKPVSYEPYRPSNRSAAGFNSEASGLAFSTLKFLLMMASLRCFA